MTGIFNVLVNLLVPAPKGELDLEQLAKRTEEILAASDDEQINLHIQLSKTGYPKDGNLYKRIKTLDHFMRHDVPKSLKALRFRHFFFKLINVFLALLILAAVYIIVEPFSELLPKFATGERFTLVDSLLNLITTTVIVLFGIRQLLRELCQTIVKQLVDKLHALIHLLDMHQLAKADRVDYGTRLVIADTIIICGKVAAYIHDRTDDPYVVGSIKHLENYSELMAARILKTKIGS